MSGTEPAPGLRISSDPGDVDFEVLHAFLSGHSTWARGIPRDVLERALAFSLCFSLRLDGRFAGFARVITDRATFAYLCDVFVLPELRGRGLSKAMMAAVDAHPDLQGLRRFVLATADAHGLYAQHGFTLLGQPEWFMERYRPDIYSS